MPITPLSLFCEKDCKSKTHSHFLRFLNQSFERSILHYHALKLSFFWSIAHLYFDLSNKKVGRCSVSVLSNKQRVSWGSVECTSWFLFGHNLFRTALISRYYCQVGSVEYLEKSQFLALVGEFFPGSKWQTFFKGRRVPPNSANSFRQNNFLPRGGRWGTPVAEKISIFPSPNNASACMQMFL